MHLGSQRPLVGWLPNMHGRHPAVVIGLHIISNKILSLLLYDHARAGATPLAWSTETDFVVVVGHHNGAFQN